MALHRGTAPVPVGPSERWSMDFVHDTLADGRPFRILAVVDAYSDPSRPLFRVLSESVGDIPRNKPAIRHRLLSEPSAIQVLVHLRYGTASILFVEEGPMPAE